MMNRHVLIYFPARLVPGLINFLALALYTRWLSAETYGRYAFVLATVGFVQVIAFYWLRLGLFRFFQLAQHDERLPILLSTTTVGFLLTSALVSLIWGIVLCFAWLDADLAAALWLGLPLLLVQAWFEQLLGMHQAALAAKRYALLSAAQAIFNLAIALCFIAFLNRSEQGLLLGLIGGTALVVLIDTRHWASLISLRLVDRALASELLRYGMPLAITFALNYIVSTSDRFLLQYLLGSEQAVGLYAVGYDLANQTVTVLFVIINLAAYPLVVHALEKKGRAAARDQLRDYATLLIALTLPASAGLILVARPIVAVMLGDAFHSTAVELMPWIVVSAFLAGVKAFYFDLAYQLGFRTKLQIWAVVAAAAINVALNLWWIPLFGIMGAAYATLAAYALALLISIVLGRNVFPLPLPASAIVRTTIATAFMAIVLWFLPDRGVSSWVRLGELAGVGTAAYAASAWILDIGHIRERSSVVLHWSSDISKEKPSESAK